jgi:DNA (cytosine-5)-methyltransferase 1
VTPEEAYQELLRQADPALRAGLKKYRTRVLTLIREELGARSLLRTVDLLSGAGGFTLGAMEAGCFVGLALDTDETATATARAAGHRAEQAPASIAGNHESIMWGVDLLIAGPPCQPFSEMGRGKGKYDVRDGFPAFLDAIDALEPRRAVAENVSGLMSKRYTAYRNQLLQDMRERFKWVGVWQLNAKDFGAPQSRKRVFIVGAERALDPPQPQHGPGREQRYRTVADVLPNLGAPAVHVRSKTAKSRSIHEPSPTVATKGTMYTAVRPGLIYGKDPHEGRALTPEEQALLQTFPEDYPFQGGVKARYKQVGNAVPRVLARAVVKAARTGLIAKRMKPAEVIAELAKTNPDAQLLGPEFNDALIGISNATGHTQELVAVYGLGRLKDLAIRQLERDPPDYLSDDPDERAEEIFGVASDYVENGLWSQQMPFNPQFPSIQMEDADDPMFWEWMQQNP